MTGLACRLTAEEEREITEQSIGVLTSVPFVVGNEAREQLGEMYDTLDEAIMAFEGNYSR